MVDQHCSSKVSRFSKFLVLRSLIYNVSLPLRTRTSRANRGIQRISIPLLARALNLMQPLGQVRNDRVFCIQRLITLDTLQNCRSTCVAWQACVPSWAAKLPGPLYIRYPIVALGRVREQRYLSYNYTNANNLFNKHSLTCIDGYLHWRNNGSWHWEITNIDATILYTIVLIQMIYPLFVIYFKIERFDLRFVVHRTNI